MRTLAFLILVVFTSQVVSQDTLPDTGISGVYEVMVGADDAQPLIRHFAEFGFEVVKKAGLDAVQAQALYGVASALTSYRLQNGDIDSHGLLRILEWETPRGQGVGYAPPETIGQRLAVMRTRDIVRLYDSFSDARRQGERWLPIEPIFDDLYDMSDKKLGILERRVGVRENAVYGERFNHVFFQRYGYTIPGYGTIGDESPLQTSEFTHHDFFIKGDIGEVTAYYSAVLGLKAEAEPVLSGDWQQGPEQVFQLRPGQSHWYIGFVSPNNICGKLKFFAPKDPELVADRSDEQKIGAEGISLHSLYSSKLEQVYQRAKDYGLAVSELVKNEFGERAFVFTGPDGAAWQILEEPRIKRKPVTKFELVNVNN